GAHGFGAPPRERQVVRVAADPVGVTDGVDSIVGPILQLGGEIVELRRFTGTHFGPVVAEVRRCAQRLTRHGLGRSGRLRLGCRGLRGDLALGRRFRLAAPEQEQEDYRDHYHSDNRNRPERARFHALLLYATGGPDEPRTSLSSPAYNIVHSLI